ncbi:Uncharacterised protein [Candidatus Gugararchaeum adminiculabundum]|nr:Uncharacterised protein [Candidatus Gugararchaeum adminiculabundum]
MQDYKSDYNRKLADFRPLGRVHSGIAKMAGVDILENPTIIDIGGGKGKCFDAAVRLRRKSKSREIRRSPSFTYLNLDLDREALARSNGFCVVADRTHLPVRNESADIVFYSFSERIRGVGARKGMEYCDIYLSSLNLTVEFDEVMGALNRVIMSDNIVLPYLGAMLALKMGGVFVTARWYGPSDEESGFNVAGTNIVSDSEKVLKLGLLNGWQVNDFLKTGGGDGSLVDSVKVSIFRKNNPTEFYLQLSEKMEGLMKECRHALRDFRKQEWYGNFFGVPAPIETERRVVPQEFGVYG